MHIFLEAYILNIQFQAHKMFRTLHICFETHRLDDAQARALVLKKKTKLSTYFTHFCTQYKLKLPF